MCVECNLYIYPNYILFNSEEFPSKFQEQDSATWGEDCKNKEKNSSVKEKSGTVTQVRINDTKYAIGELQCSDYFWQREQSQEIH